MKVTPSLVIREDIQALSAYHVQQAAGMIKLDAMENPYPLPESLQMEIAHRISRIGVNRYPDPSAPILQGLLRDCMAIPQGTGILLGNGSDELLQIMLTACAKPGAVVMTPSPGFVMYRMYSLYLGLKFVELPLEADFTLDAGKFITAMREVAPAVVFIAYPNNPTGNSFPDEDLVSIIREAPGLVVIDEAYQPFARGSFLTRIHDFPNLVVLRTLSKLGLAGIRLGYAVGDPGWIAQFDKVRSPYNVNALTQCFGECVLERYPILLDQADLIRAGRADLMGKLGEIPGVTTFPSDANFLMIRVPDASKVFGALKSRGILVKNLDGAHPILRNCLRITVGSGAENVALLSAMAEILAGAGAGDGGTR